MSAPQDEETKEGGRPDFEAPTKDVHRGPPSPRRAGNSLPQPGSSRRRRAERTTALGMQSEVKLHRGGTPQQAGLGNRLAPARLLSLVPQLPEPAVQRRRFLLTERRPAQRLQMPARAAAQAVLMVVRATALATHDAAVAV